MIDSTVAGFLESYLNMKKESSENILPKTLIVFRSGLSSSQLFESYSKELIGFIRGITKFSSILQQVCFIKI